MAVTFVEIFSDGNIMYLSDVTIINSHNNILSIQGVHGTLQVSGNTLISSNQGSASVLRGEICFKEFVQFSGNTAQNYESIFQISDSSMVSFEGETIFTNNKGRQGGAISVSGLSYLQFIGDARFINNSAEDGGAISIKEGSFINLIGNTTIIFETNKAVFYGGAIYVEDDSFWIHKNKFRIKCFICKKYKDIYYKLKFENNTAGIAGAALYGGWIDLCEPNNDYDINSHKFLEFKAENSVQPGFVCALTQLSTTT